MVQENHRLGEVGGRETITLELFCLWLRKRRGETGLRPPGRVWREGLAAPIS